MSEAPTGAAAPVRRVAALLGALVALTIVGSSAVAVALPEVARDLSLDTAGTAWVLACFSLTFSVATAVFGRLADRYGLASPLRAGVLLFATGSLVAGAAGSFPVLIGGRLLQGAGAGAVPVLALGIVAARFQGPARSQALGGLTAMVSIVSGSGPLIGGAVAELASWRAVLVLPALALLVAEPVARLAPTGPPVGLDRRGGIDVAGAVLVAATAAAVTLLLQSPATGLGPPAAAVFAALALGGGTALHRHVRRRPHGFVPAAVAFDRSVQRCAFGGLAVLAAYLGMLLAVPLLLTDLRGWRPLQIGLALLPAAAFGAVTASTTSWLARRVGRLRLAAILSAGSAAGLLVAAASPGRPLALVGGMTLVAAGFAGGQVALLDTVAASVDEAHRGAALGLFNLLFFTGGAIGAAAVGGLSGVVTLPGALALLAAVPLAGALAVRGTGRAT